MVSDKNAARERDVLHHDDHHTVEGRKSAC